jgi:hypothetical protein
MTTNQTTSQQHSQDQNEETKSKDKSATHLCITIRWRGVPPPAAPAWGGWFRC